MARTKHNTYFVNRFGNYDSKARYWTFVKWSNRKDAKWEAVGFDNITDARRYGYEYLATSKDYILDFTDKPTGGKIIGVIETNRSAMYPIVWKHLGGAGGKELRVAVLNRDGTLGKALDSTYFDL